MMSTRLIPRITTLPAKPSAECPYCQLPITPPRETCEHVIGWRKVEGGYEVEFCED